MTGRAAADEARTGVSRTGASRTGAGGLTYRGIWGELAARPRAGGDEPGPRGERPDERSAERPDECPDERSDEWPDDRTAERADGGGRFGPGFGSGAGPGGSVSPAAADESAPHVLYVHFHRRAPEPAAQPAGPGGRPVALGEGTYGGLLAMLAEFSPVVEALPPDAALVDVRGARRYFGRDAAGLADLIRLRALALHGVDCTVGAAANPMLARMAAQDGPPGAVRTLAGDPVEVAAFLARKPAAALHGVGPATARTLCTYGLDSVGRIAAAPLSALQRILGASTGRRIHERARGLDPTPVTPNAPARSLAAEHRFGGDELDPGRRRRALLTLADGLGSQLRTSGQTARGLALTVRYADGSSTVRTRAFEEPTAHTPALTAAAYALHAALGLERARVRAVALRAEDLRDADRTARQLTFDPADDKARRAWAAVDRARARFGAAAVGPAALLDVA